MISAEDAGAVRYITMDRPDKRNAITTELALALGRALDEAARDNSVRVVVLRGTGPVFSAGMDIEELQDFADPTVFAERREQIVEVWNLCERMAKPTIAQMHGAAIGVGLELALACDLRIASDETVMGLPETRFGGVPDLGGCSRLAALVGLGRAKEIVLTASVIGAKDAERMGLVNRAVSGGELAATVTDLCDRLVRCDPAAVGQAKRILDRAAKPALAETLRDEGRTQVGLLRENGIRVNELGARIGKPAAGRRER